MLRDDRVAQVIKMGLFPEEIGFVRGDQVDHHLTLAVVCAHEVVVRTEAVKLQSEHALSQAADQKNHLGVGQADAGDVVNETLKACEFLWGDLQICHVA